ncbi:MAG: 50S ribosomal protein P1 [Archaeoglobaceae archaeon]|uniref:Large ribosomal subunit protein P1 n=1 Tax=Archaeoglobus fulgidus TaxID=2234 RepID=A0A7J3M414_ARCFL
MEYVYAALLLHSAGKEITEENVKAVLSAAGIAVNEARVKALVSALEGINISEILQKSTAMPVVAQPAGAPKAEEKKEEKKEEEKKKKEEEEKKEEEAIEGLASLFG